jgi:ribonuclease HI
MRFCDVIIILAGVYSSYSKWIDKEIKIAKNFSTPKPILAIEPWASEKTSLIVKNNWKNSQKKEVLNKGEWQKILGLLAEIETRKIKIKWTHVYGHTGEKWNERVDEIAKSFAGGEKLKLAKAEKY